MNHIGKLNVRRRTGTMTSGGLVPHNGAKTELKTTYVRYGTIHLAGAWGAYPRAGGFRAAVHRGGGMHE